MDLRNEDDPNDDFDTKVRKRWRRERILKMLDYEAGLKSKGVADIQFEPRWDFDKAANDDSLAFLAKLITAVLPTPHPDTKEELVTTIYDRHFTVFYLPRAEGRHEHITCQKLEMDYTDKNKVQAEQAVIERVKAAMILAHSAKAMGWKKVNFGDTTDELSRYILKLICKDIGLDASSEKIVESKIPPYAAFNGGLKQKAFDMYEIIKENPAYTVAEQKYPPEPEPEVEQTDIEADIENSPFAFEDQGPPPPSP